MAITYEDALATLQSMFAEPWDRDSLDYVLRNQKGHMENTVDLILRHGDKDPQVLIDQLEAGIDPSQTAVAADEELARQLSQQQQIGGGGSGRAAAAMAPPSRATGGKGTPTALPDDFLRVPGAAAAGAAGGSSTFMDDEALARMLQDQLFSEELSRNREFAHLARGRSTATHRSSGRSSGSSRRASGASAAGGGGVNPIAAAGSKINEFAARFSQQNRTGSGRNVQQQQQQPSPGADFAKKLSELGDNAKRRLQLMAAQFQANQQHRHQQNSAANPHAQPAGGVASQQETRGLLDGGGDDDHDHDNMELAARKDL